MLLLTCPVCTIRASETEFVAGGAGPGAPAAPMLRGIVQEWWRCDKGCGAWFQVERHLTSHRVLAWHPPATEPDDSAAPESEAPQ